MDTAISTVELSSELLRAVAEQLKLPLIQIARQSELLELSTSSESAPLRTLQYGAEVALKLVDAYLLGLELSAQQNALPLEPVSLSWLLDDVTHQLTAAAKQYDVTLELRIDGRYGPVMAHAPALRAALISLGYGLISNAAKTRPGKPTVLYVANWRSRDGLVAGLYGKELLSLTPAALKRARRLYGKARQPLTELSTNTAGIFVADALLSAMSVQLRAGRHRSLQGLAATFQPSKQLQLV